MSFHELAIAAAVATKGATAGHLDLFLQTKMMRLAFAHYFRKARPVLNGNQISYKGFFQPGSIQSIEPLGAGMVHGISRRAITFTPIIIEHILVNIWRAVQTRKQSDNHDSLGESVRIRTPLDSLWNPSYIQQTEDLIAKITRGSDDSTKPTIIKGASSKRRARCGPCYFGHASTSARDASGKLGGISHHTTRHGRMFPQVSHYAKGVLSGSTPQRGLAKRPNALWYLRRVPRQRPQNSSKLKNMRRWPLSLSLPPHVFLHTSILYIIYIATLLLGFLIQSAVKRKMTSSTAVPSA